MNTRVIMLGWFAVIIAATPVWAYTPHVGDRAAPLSGFSIDGTTIDLEDFRGKWVVLEFWSTTCGPCIRQMPELLKVTSTFREQGNLELLLVNLDRKDRIPEAKAFVSKNNIDCPVIIGGNGSVIVGPAQVEAYKNSISPLALDWNIRGLPTSIIINPDGVIAAKHVKPDQLGELLDILIYGNDYLSSIVGCRSSIQLAADGQPEFLLVDLWSPQKSPLQVTINYTHIEANLIEHNGFTIPTQRKYLRSNPNGHDFQETVKFSDETSYLLKVPISMNDYLGIQYKVLVKIPGTENLDNGAGIWTKQIGNFMTDFPTYSYESS